MIGSSAGLAILAFIGAPLFIVIAAVALLGFYTTGRPPADVTGDFARLVQTDTLITIPLFTFAGYLLAESGAPKRLVAVSRALFGWFPGGMAIVTLIACAFFTTFTGASGITIVALGALMLPVLLKQGYPRNFSLGLVTTCGSRGLLFPPSLPVIIYGYVASVDIAKLYVAGAVPGLLDLVVVALWCARTGVFANVPRTPFAPKAALKAIYQALPEVLLPVWLVALIVTAVLKVPEAAAMAGLYVLVVEVVIYRDIHPFKDLPRITKDSTMLSGVIVVIICASLGLSNLLVTQEIPQAIVHGIRQSIDSKWTFLLALNLFLLVVGCLMDIFSAIVIVVPLIMPLATAYGVDPIHLAVIFLVNLEIGYSTPPVGMNLFIASFRFNQPVLRLYRAAIPFVLLALVVLLAVTYIEPLSTFALRRNLVGTGRQRAAPAVTTPASSKGASSPKPTRTEPTLMDGICDEKHKDSDPDCEDINIDDEAQSDEADDAKGPTPVHQPKP